MRVPSLGQEDPLEEGMATHSSILAWRIPWTEEPGGLQSVGSQRVGHNWSNITYRHICCLDKALSVNNAGLIFFFLNCFHSKMGSSGWQPGCSSSRHHITVNNRQRQQKVLPLSCVSILCPCEETSSRGSTSYLSSLLLGLNYIACQYTCLLLVRKMVSSRWVGQDATPWLERIGYLIKSGIRVPAGRCSYAQDGHSPGIW